MDDEVTAAAVPAAKTEEAMLERPGKQALIEVPEEDFAKQVRGWLKESAAFKAPAVERRKREHRIYAGDQWEGKDTEVAKRLKRPALTLNLMLGIISAIEGEERENRKEIKFFGNEEGDDGAAGGLNRLLKWIQKSCGGEFAQSKAAKNAAIGGEDWLGCEVDFFEDPEGKIKVVQVDEAEIFDDPLDRSEAATGGRYLLRVKMWAEDEIEAQWPGAVDELLRENFNIEPGLERDESRYRDIYSVATDTNSMKLFDAKEKRWAIIECWWQQVLPGHVVANPETGLLEEYTQGEFERLVEEREAARREALFARIKAASQPPVLMPTAIGMQAMPAPLPPMPPAIDSIERPIRRYFQGFVCVDRVLERKESPIPRLKRWPYVPVRAYFNKDKGEFFGFVSPAIDPQLQHNVEQSVIVQLLQLMPKASWMGPKGSFHNKQEWMEKLAQPGQLLEYMPKANGMKPEPITPPTVSRHLIEMAMIRPQQVRDIAGIPLEMSGQRQGADTGVVIEKRQKAGRTGLTPFFDNFRQSKIELGKVLLAFIQHYIPVGRQIRVIGEENKSEFVMMTDAMRLERFDITVDEGEAGVNERFEALFVLQTTLPQLAKAGVPITPEFIDLLPLPTHLRKKWRRQIAWEMTVANRLPPPGWEEGMPLPMAGAIPPGAPIPPAQ